MFFNINLKITLDKINRSYNQSKYEQKKINQKKKYIGQITKAYGQSPCVLARSQNDA